MRCLLILIGGWLAASLLFWRFWYLLLERRDRLWRDATRYRTVRMYREDLMGWADSAEALDARIDGITKTHYRGDEG